MDMNMERLNLLFVPWLKLQLEEEEEDALQFAFTVLQLPRKFLKSFWSFA